jgi:AraC-like DNA-binding protein
MRSANTYDQIIQIVERYLWNRIKKIKYDDQPVDQLGKIILQPHIDFNIGTMSSMACLSVRQFERRFEQNFGITPKFYSRINRFYQAFRLKDRNPEMDWLTIAIQTGYHDYQHMVKDFKQFAGVSPNSLIEAQSRAPERLLGLD